MQNEGKKELSTEPYKGVRDFYPEDMFVQNYIFSTMREAAESFGFAEYSASVLEPSELYEAKTGEEIVREQTYTFTDRGERSVTLRPEMTPTVARMVAAKRRELPFPLRWYSIPNVFRYERPQRGRLREHWQLNCDIFGAKNTEADAEIIALARAVMQGFGAEDALFEIRINHRKLLQTLFTDVLELDEKQTHHLSKLIDRKNKISSESFAEEARGIVADKSESLVRVLGSDSLESFLRIALELENSEGAAEIRALQSRLKERGIPNVIFDPTLVRGFDYYTDVVFEVFDRSPENNRSLFGGGRYDSLVDIFGVESVAATGFGMGDVTIRDFLTVHNLLPAYTATTDVYICTVGAKHIAAAQTMATELRAKGIAVAVNLLDKKIGDQIKTADKQAVPFVLILGESEIASGLFKLKHLGTGEEKEVGSENIADTIFSFIG